MKLLKIAAVVLFVAICAFFVWYAYNAVFVVSVKGGLITDGFGRELFEVSGFWRIMNFYREDWAGPAYFLFDSIVGWAAIGINYALLKFIRNS